MLVSGVQQSDSVIHICVCIYIYFFFRFFSIIQGMLLNISFFYFLKYKIFFFSKFIYLFIYFWLRWVFVAARGLSLVAASGGSFSLRCVGLTVVALLCCGARALGTQASVVVARGLSSCGSRALERRLSSCGARA